MVTPEASLVVRAPLRLPLRQIERIVDEKREWITRKIAEVRRRPMVIARNFVTGESLDYLGRSYSLDVGDYQLIEIVDDRLLLPQLYRSTPRTKLERWYQRQARAVFRERIEYFSPLMGCRPTSVALSSARRQWGSCAHDGTIRLNWRLVMAPLEIIDYVVVHELAHLTVPNHSARFWRCVAEAVPDYARHRRWLREHGQHLRV